MQFAPVAQAAGAIKTCVAASGKAQRCDIKQSIMGAGDFVTRLLFAPMKADAQDPLVYRQSSTWQESAHIQFTYADGVKRSLEYTSANAAKYLTIGAIFEFPVPWRQAALTGISIKTHGASNLRGVVLGPQLLTRSQSFALKIKLVAMYAGFAGLALALIVYNFSLWSAMRNGFQLLYCAMVAGMVLYTISASGQLMVIFPEMANNDRLRINYVLLALVGVTALNFIRFFFEPQVFGKRLIFACRAFAVSAFVSSLMVAVFAPLHHRLLDQLYYIAMTVMLSMVVPILISAWRNKSRYFWMFVLAWSAPIISSTLRAANGFNLIGYNFLLDNANLIAMGIEALFSSMMVTVRLRELSHERDDAVAGEQVARRMAATDPLTGLLNRRAFLDLAIGRRVKQRLMLIDIDNFKQVNDRFGHDIGDEVLSAVADAIQACRPAGSLAVRLGGEEFALLIPLSAGNDCTPEGVLDAVRCKVIPGGGKVTISMGISDGAIGTDEDWKRLYRMADAALYRAKSDGRDRACRSTDFRAAA